MGDDKLMDLMKQVNKENEQKKKNNVDLGEQLTDAQLDRKIKAQMQAQKAAFANTTDQVNKVVKEVEAAEAKEEKKAAKKAAKEFGFHLSADVGNEHQGIAYNAAHYDGNDEEAEMLASLNNRDSLRFEMGL